MPTPQEIADAYQRAHDDLSAIASSPRSSDKTVAAANTALNELDLARTAQIAATYAT